MLVIIVSHKHRKRIRNKDFFPPVLLYFHQLLIGVKVLALRWWSAQDTTGMALDTSSSSSSATSRPRLPAGHLG